MKNFKYKQILYAGRRIVKPLFIFMGKHCYLPQHQPRVLDMDDTLNILLTGSQSLCRFGDGELKWIYHLPQNSFQQYDPGMSKRLKEIIHSDRPDVLIGIPDIFGNMSAKTDDDQNFWWYTMAGQRMLWLRLLTPRRKFYYNAEVTRCYMSVRNKSDCAGYFRKWKKLFSGKSLLLIEGCDTRFGIGNDLLQDAADIHRILIPSENAYQSYESILNTVLHLYVKDQLVLAAAGPTATILCYDLSLQGIRAIDIGHLDIEYEWFLRKAKERIIIPGKYINELSQYGGRTVSPISDRRYESQIIARID